MPFTGQLRIPFARRSHTSHKAAVSLDGQHRTAKLAHLMALYRKAGSYGMTDPEARVALSHHLGVTVPISSICSLRNAIVEHGLVAKAGERMGDFGKMVQVWFWIGEAQ